MIINTKTNKLTSMRMMIELQSKFSLYHRKVQYKHAILLEHRDSKG